MLVLEAVKHRLNGHYVNMSENYVGNQLKLASKVQQTPHAKEMFEKKIRFDLRDQENMDLLFKRKLGISGRRMNILYKLCDISLPIQEIPM
jgi:hypothetical protein